MMMGYVQARDAIVGKVEAALAADHPTVPRFYENTKQVDVTKVVDPFVRISVNFQDARQATIEAAPVTRVRGEVTFEVCCREGTGTRQAAVLFDYLDTLMKHQAVSGVTLETPSPGRKFSTAGWEKSDLNVPFYFNK